MGDIVADLEIVDGAVRAFATARLSAAAMTAQDEPWLIRLHGVPEVMANIGGTRSETETQDWLASNLDIWALHGFGQWIFRDHGGQRIGRGGLRPIDSSVGEELIEVGYVIDQPYWGQGFATEICRASIEVAKHYALEELGAITLDRNHASARVLERCGFAYERTIDHGVGPHLFFRHSLS